MDDFSWIWKTIVIFYVGRFILRLGGRKSISQMTITQVVVMIGLGSLLIQPIADEELWVTLGIGFIIVLLMILTEYIEIKFDILETISTGKAKMVIEDGNINMKKLRQLRMSVDRLETRLRQSGISSIEDIKYGSIEVSGQLGYELKENKKPATKEDINFLLNEIQQIKNSIGINTKYHLNNKQEDNIFEEIITKEDEGKNEP